MQHLSTSTISPPDVISSAERRKQVRFRMRCRPIAFFRFQFGMVGHIKNISPQGLALLYFASRNRTNTLFSIDIVCADCNFFSWEIPVTTVWDHPRTEHFGFDCVAARCCGMKFKPLTSNQKAELRHFINNCATSILKSDDGSNPAPKKKVNTYDLPTEILDDTTECVHNFACLSDSSYPLCKVRGSAGASGFVFVDSIQHEFCRYGASFGYSSFCSCPVRVALYKRHGI